MPRMVRLTYAGAAAGEPYWAASMTFAPAASAALATILTDYLNMWAVTAGRGGVQTYFPSGEPDRVIELVAGDVILLRPSDGYLAPFGLEPEGMSVINIAFAVSEWQVFADLANMSERWRTSRDPLVARAVPGGDDPWRAWSTLLERWHNRPLALDIVRFWTEVMPPLLDPSPDRELPRTAPPWLGRALALVLDEDNLRGGVPRLVELANVSPAHLWRSLRRHTGESPRELVTRLRIRHAAFLLRTTADSIGAISQRCGFSSPSYFATSFGAAYGTSPSSYRRGVRPSETPAAARIRTGGR